jgi:hypothetical protein
MVELQIVILAVAGSSPVGHPNSIFDFRLRMPLQPSDGVARPVFWLRILRDEQLNNCENLRKLLVGCEIIAPLDGIDLLAA